MNISFHYYSISFIILIILAIAFATQIIIYWSVFSRLAFYKKKNTSGNSISLEPISVVVCARDEYDNLQELIPLLLEQDYPDFEIVIVNDCSQDETEGYLREMARWNPRIKPVQMLQSLNFFQGKKFPLSMGIKSTKHDLLVLTDADCRPTSKQWLRSIAMSYKPHTEIVLGYGPYSKYKGLLNLLIRFDTLHIAMQYLSMSLCGMTYMGVGRNLSYRKSTFYNHKGFTSHYTIRSGDDDLFISQAATKTNTEICIAPDIRIESEPKRTWGAWIHQKRRHYSTGLLYNFNTKLMLGLYSGSQFLFYAALIALLCLPAAFSATNSMIYFAVLASLFIIRYVSQLIIVYRIAKQLGETGLKLYLLPFYELFFILFSGILGISSQLFKPKKW